MLESPLSRDKNFEGASLDVNSDLSDLAQQRMGSGHSFAGNWNDEIESVRVTSLYGHDTVVDRPEGRQSRVDPQGMNRTTATLA